MNLHYLGSSPKPQHPRISIKSTFKGRYKIEAIALDGTRRLLADWFDNLITNNGLDCIGNNPNWNNGCYVGSGNTAPANSDTALVSLIGSTTNRTANTQSAQSSPPYFGTETLTFRFAIGTATGNLSEVGLGSTATTLFSRALILDSLGSPTTITVLSSEALDVTYQLQQYVPTADVTGTVTIGAVNYAYTVRAAEATTSNSWAPFSGQGGLETMVVTNGAIGAITADPSGSQAPCGSVSVASYTNGNYYVDSTASFGLTDGNVSGGVSAMLLTMGNPYACFGKFQVGVSPSIPKDGTKTMTLTFRHSWNRH